VLHGLLVKSLYAVALEHDLSLSAHRPVSFGLRNTENKNANLFPDWLVEHPSFAAEVRAEYAFRIADLDFLGSSA